MPSEVQYLSIPSLAKRWDLCTRTVRKAISGSPVLQEGRMTFGTRGTRIALSSVEKYEAQHKRIKAPRVGQLKYHKEAV